jgi:hypothetical protein
MSLAGAWRPMTAWTIVFVALELLLARVTN